MTSWHFKGI